MRPSAAARLSNLKVKLRIQQNGRVFYVTLSPMPKARPHPSDLSP